MALQELGIIMEHNRANKKNGSIKVMGASEDMSDPAVAVVGTARGRGRGRSGSRGTLMRWKPKRGKGLTSAEVPWGQLREMSVRSLRWMKMI